MSNNKQQTSVEWLLEQFENKGHIGLHEKLQAKEMEKQQIKDAYYVGYENAEHTFPQGDDYYHKTYNQ